MIKNNKLSYLFYLPSFSGGGSEMVTINLANQFYKLNHKVIFLCSNNRGPLFFKLNKNIQTIDLKKKKLWHSIISIILVLYKKKPDVVFSSLIHANIFFCIVKKILPIKFFLLIRHGNPRHLNKSIKKKIKNEIFNYLIKHLYKYADLIISSGLLAKAYLSRNLKVKKSIYQINNPVFVRDEFNQRFSLKSNWIRKNKFNYLLAIGRLHEQKNFKFLIKAFSKLNLSPTLKLIIIGEGDEFNYLCQTIKNYNLERVIKIFSFKKNPLSYIYYCKAFVLSSLWEGQSNALLQAALLNKKIICSSAAGDGKLLAKKFKNIHIYKSNSHRDFRKKIYKILKSAIKKEAQTLHNMHKDFDICAIAKQYIEIINEKI